jgi:hypothetical protein
LAANGGEEGSKFPKVDFNCSNGQYPVPLKGIDIFVRAKEHLKTDVTVLHYDTGFEKGDYCDKKRGYVFCKSSVHGIREALDMASIHASFRA